MNKFEIEKVARYYIDCRFPKASEREKQKYIDDWSGKLRSARGLVKDFVLRVGDPKGKKIIDVGCGNGGVSITFAMYGAYVHGIEIEKELLDIATMQAKSMSVDVEFLLYDGFNIPFSNNHFDYALSTSVLEHTDDPILYLKQILNVVKPGGKLYLSFPNKIYPKETHTQLYFLTYLPKSIRQKYVKLFKRNPLPDNNLHFYGFFDLLRMLDIIEKNNKYKWHLIKDVGFSKNIFKKASKSLLNVVGINYKALLPQVIVVLEKRSSNQKKV